MYWTISVLSIPHKQQANGKCSVKICSTDFAVRWTIFRHLLISYIVSDLQLAPFLNLRHLSSLSEKTSHPKRLNWHAHQATSQPIPWSLTSCFLVDFLNADRQLEGKWQNWKCISLWESLLTEQVSTWSEHPKVTSTLSFPSWEGEHSVHGLSTAGEKAQGSVLSDNEGYSTSRSTV